VSTGHKIMGCANLIERVDLNQTQVLYHTRWPVEEDYKALKSRIEVENWSGKSVLAVYQDFHVLLFQRSTIGPLLEQLWRVMSQTIEPVRPDRSFPRSKRVKPKKFAFSYKPTR
jgi:hypothetical protein